MPHAILKSALVKTWYIYPLRVAWWTIWSGAVSTFSNNDSLDLLRLLVFVVTVSDIFTSSSSSICYTFLIRFAKQLIAFWLSSTETRIPVGSNQIINFLNVPFGPLTGQMLFKLPSPLDCIWMKSLYHRGESPRIISLSLCWICDHKLNLLTVYSRSIRAYYKAWNSSDILVL